MKQYFTYFVDDNIRFLENLSKNRPASVFDDPYLKAHKKLHDKYGLKVQFNLFYQNLDKTWNLSMMTDAYKEEFLANKDWISFGFHAKHEFPDFPYLNATYDEIWEDYTAIEKAIEHFAGKEMITRSLVAHWVSMTKEGLQALADKGAKMITATIGDIHDSPEIRNTLSPAHRATLEKNKNLPVSEAKISVGTMLGGSYPFLCNYNHFTLNDAVDYYGKLKMYKEPETGMYYRMDASITMNCEKLSDFPRLLEELTKHEYAGILIHEQYFYEDYVAYQPDFTEKIELAVKTLLDAGFEHVLLDDLVDFQD